jgi:transposase
MTPVAKSLNRHSSKVPTEERELRKENSQLRLRLSELEHRVCQLQKEVDNTSEREHAWRVRYLKLEQGKTKEVQSLSLKLAQAEEKIEEIKATLAWHQKHTFGERSEQSEATEASSQEATEQPPEQAVPEGKRGKKKGAPGHGRLQRSGINEETNELDVPEQKRRCQCCGKQYRLLPKRDKSTVLEMLQELYKIVDLGSTYVKDCDCPESNDNPRMVRSAPPDRVYPRASLGPELWTDILIEKFLFQKPLHRIAQKYLLLGATVPVSTMCGGLKKIDGLLDALAMSILEHAKGAEQWNMDETTWRVFGEDKQKWWLWVVVTGDCIAYILDESRSSAVPKAFFEGVSSGTLITDRYSAYKALKDSILKAYCWAHVRRDFIKIRDGIPSLRSWAEDWIKRIDKLFEENAKRVSLLHATPVALGEEIFAANYKISFLLEQMQEQLETQLKGKLKERQRKALTSLKKHWEGLTIFRDNSRVPMDNNAAERALRNPVVGRKNYYGSGSAWSGHLAAKLFTIFQTWLYNGLEPIRLLQDFLKSCARQRGQPPPVDDYLPWKMSDERKALFSLRGK